jgi:hypothetical protein
MPVCPALRRLKQVYHEFKTNLGYVARPYLKIKMYNTCTYGNVTRNPLCYHTIRKILKNKINTKLRQKRKLQTNMV